jgi:hypothetical protein
MYNTLEETMNSPLLPALALQMLALPAWADGTDDYKGSIGEHDGSCLTWHLHTLAADARTDGAEAALGEAMAEHGWGLPGKERPADGAVHSMTDKTVRNSYTGDHSLHETDNFALRWSSESGFDQGDVEELAENFELSWSSIVDEMGYPTPEDSDSFKFNVYIGDTGGGLPSAEGSAGYFWYDTDWYPMIVISKDIVGWPDSAKLTASHEFFHAVQAAAGAYTFDNQTGWWFEATSNWILEEVYRSEGGYSNTLYSVALRPEISLNHFGDYATEGIEADHHYGASIFASYLSENHGGRDSIRETWLSPGSSDPLLSIESLLDGMGEDMEGVHLDYALRSIAWDYVFGWDYALSVSDYTGGGESHRISGSLAGTSSDWHGPGDWPPHTYGSNAWELSDMPSKFTVEFSGDDAASWRVGLARVDGGEHSREFMDMDGSTGSMVLAGYGTPDEAWLVVSAIDGVVDSGQTYSYEFKVRKGGIAEEDSPKGGCSTAGTGALCGAWLLGLGAGLRRRDRQPE